MRLTDSITASLTPDPKAIKSVLRCYQVVVRADVFRYAQFCALPLRNLRSFQSPHSLLKPCHTWRIPHWAIHCFSIFTVTCAQKSAQFYPKVRNSNCAVAEQWQVYRGFPSSPKTVAVMSWFLGHCQRNHVILLPEIKQ